MRRVIEEGLSSLRIPFAAAQIDMLETFYEEITRGNRRQNLVKAEGAGLITRHILDSLAGLPLLRTLTAETGGHRVADIGSGAGLPGIPLAVFCPELAFDLIERSGRRAGFLQNAVALLGLRNVAVKEQDVSRLRTSYDVITFRAFRPLAESASLVRNLLAEKGRILAFGARRGGIDEQCRLLPSSMCCERIERIEVPGLDAERHLVVLRLAG